MLSSFKSTLALSHLAEPAFRPHWTAFFLDLQGLLGVDHSVEELPLGLLSSYPITMLFIYPKPGTYSLSINLTSRLDFNL